MSTPQMTVMERLERADTGIQATLLEHHAHLRTKVRALAPRVDAEHAHLARVGAAVPLEDLDRRRLARAVGTE